MNALLTVGRTLLAHREKVVLGAMVVLCAVLGLLSVRRETVEPEQVRPPRPPGPPVPPTEYKPYQLENDRSLEDLRKQLEGRTSIFLRAQGGGGSAGGGPGVAVWPVIEVRRVFQPTPDGPWVAQLTVDGRSYFPREGQVFANNNLELVRIDRTRKCAEILRRADDATKEFCEQAG